MAKWFPFLLYITVSNALWAQHTFLISQAPHNYTVKVKVEKCTESDCSGKATIELTSNTPKGFSQVFLSKDVNFEIIKGNKLATNTAIKYSQQGAVKFDDFNFDHQTDLAIQNGNNGSYGAPTFDIYVFNSTQQRFVKSTELTDLVLDNLGMFEVDHARKRLICKDKSGCCLLLKTEYEVVFRKGLRKVREVEEDSDGETVKVTTRELKNGQWVSNVKKYKVAYYYKQ